MSETEHTPRTDCRWVCDFHAAALDMERAREEQSAKIGACILRDSEERAERERIREKREVERDALYAEEIKQLRRIAVALERLCAVMEER